MNQSAEYLTDIHLLCITCHQPIKGRINTPQWIRVEWISPDGECQACEQLRKEQASGQREAKVQHAKLRL